MEFDGEIIKFNIFNTMKYPSFRAENDQEGSHAESLREGDAESVYRYGGVAQGALSIEQA